MREREGEREPISHHHHTRLPLPGRSTHSHTLALLINSTEAGILLCGNRVYPLTTIPPFPNSPRVSLEAGGRVPLRSPGGPFPAPGDTGWAGSSIGRWFGSVRFAMSRFWTGDESVLDWRPQGVPDLAMVCARDHHDGTEGRCPDTKRIARGWARSPRDAEACSESRTVSARRRTRCLVRKGPGRTRKDSEGLGGPWLRPAPSES